MAAAIKETNTLFHIMLVLVLTAAVASYNCDYQYVMNHKCQTASVADQSLSVCTNHHNSDTCDTSEGTGIVNLYGVCLTNYLFEFPMVQGRICKHGYGYEVSHGRFSLWPPSENAVCTPMCNCKSCHVYVDLHDVELESCLAPKTSIQRLVYSDYYFDNRVWTSNSATDENPDYWDAEFLSYLSSDTELKVTCASCDEPKYLVNNQCVDHTWQEHETAWYNQMLSCVKHATQADCQNDSFETPSSDPGEHFETKTTENCAWQSGYYDAYHHPRHNLDPEKMALRPRGGPDNSVMHMGVSILQGSESPLLERSHQCVPKNYDFKLKPFSKKHYQRGTLQSMPGHVHEFQLSGVDMLHQNQVVTVQRNTANGDQVLLATGEPDEFEFTVVAVNTADHTYSLHSNDYDDSWGNTNIFVSVFSINPDARFVVCDGFPLYATVPHTNHEPSKAIVCVKGADAVPIVRHSAAYMHAHDDVYLPESERNTDLKVLANSGVVTIKVSSDNTLRSVLNSGECHERYREVGVATATTTTAGQGVGFFIACAPILCYDEFSGYEYDAQCAQAPGCKAEEAKVYELKNGAWQNPTSTYVFLCVPLFYTIGTNECQTAFSSSNRYHKAALPKSHTGVFFHSVKERIKMYASADLEQFSAICVSFETVECKSATPSAITSQQFPCPVNSDGDYQSLDCSDLDVGTANCAQYGGMAALDTWTSGTPPFDSTCTSYCTDCRDKAQYTCGSTAIDCGDVHSSSCVSCIFQNPTLSNCPIEDSTTKTSTTKTSTTFTGATTLPVFDCNSNNPCGKCQGNCATDNDCVSGFVCTPFGQETECTFEYTNVCYPATTTSTTTLAPTCCQENNCCEPPQTCGNEDCTDVYCGCRAATCVLIDDLNHYTCNGERNDNCAADGCYAPCGFGTCTTALPTTTLTTKTTTTTTFRGDCCDTKNNRILAVDTTTCDTNSEILHVPVGVCREDSEWSGHGAWIALPLGGPIVVLTIAWLIARNDCTHEMKKRGRMFREAMSGTFLIVVITCIALQWRATRDLKNDYIVVVRILGFAMAAAALSMQYYLAGVSHAEPILPELSIIGKTKLETWLRIVFQYAHASTAWLVYGIAARMTYREIDTTHLLTEVVGDDVRVPMLVIAVGLGLQALPVRTIYPRDTTKTFKYKNDAIKLMQITNGFTMVFFLTTSLYSFSNILNQPVTEWNFAAVLATVSAWGFYSFLVPTINHDKTAYLKSELFLRIVAVVTILVGGILLYREIDRATLPGNPLQTYLQTDRFLRYAFLVALLWSGIVIVLDTSMLLYSAFVSPAPAHHKTRIWY